MDVVSGVSGSELRFAAFVEGLVEALGHADRIAPMKAYCTGFKRWLGKSGHRA